MADTDDFIDGKLKDGFHGGEGIDVVFPEGTSAAEIQRVISELCSAGWVCIVSGEVFHLTTAAALN